jgi:hypothetical protein
MTFSIPLSWNNRNAEGKKTVNAYGGFWGGILGILGILGVIWATDPVGLAPIIQ